MTLYFDALTKQGKKKIPAATPPRSDVCLFLEGTYPFVAGGVSSWVHEIIRGLPELRFSLVAILPDSQKPEPRYDLPENVDALYFLPLTHPGYDKQPLFKHIPSEKTLATSNQFHDIFTLNKFPEFIGGETTECHSVFETLIEKMGSEKWDISSMLFSKKIWRRIKDMYYHLEHDCSFADYWWTWKNLHTGIFALMNAYIPEAGVYHTVSTGYAGLLAAKASFEKSIPLLLTEHGIYSKERKIEISRSEWIYVQNKHLYRADEDDEIFRKLWITAFRIFSKLCYDQANEIITLYSGNQEFQAMDGADSAKMKIIPNGVYSEQLEHLPREPQPKKIIGFVGRIVPIKDVKTFIRAVSVLLKFYPDAEAWLMGPTEENEEYYDECVELVKYLKIDQQVRFTGKVNLAEYYTKIDILVLTSISEAQPLVILEAYAQKIPVVATDVGSCRELIEGNEKEGDTYGKSGIVTGMTNPTETAMSILYILTHEEEYREMGEAGYLRLKNHYDMPNLIATYRELYLNYINSESN